MSELKSDPTKQPCESKPVNASRRKLTGAALAGPVILGTLASKQALGGAPYHCTISGQISGSGSARPGDNITCAELGRSPGFWKNHWSCWGLDVTVGGVTVQGVFRPFNDIFIGSVITARMGDILEGCKDVKDQLARAAIASYLNAKHFPNSYPLSTNQVLSLYANDSGGYLYGTCDLKCYFETLYGNSDAWPAGSSSSNCPSDPQGFKCTTPTPGSVSP